MWTPATRRQHSPGDSRYGSDLTDAGMGDHCPVDAAADRSMREIMSAIFHVLRSGCAWRMLPKDFPPMTTVYGWFLPFRREGLF